MKGAHACQSRLATLGLAIAAITMETTKTQTPAKRIAVVTGANKGIGFEICRQLLAEGVVVVLTARDAERGAAAVESLRTSAGAVEFQQLDVTDAASAAALADFVRARFGRLDILVNNAGILGRAPKAHGSQSFFKTEETYQVAEECMNTNYYGTEKVTEALIPLLILSQSPRIVNVSSSYGMLQHIPNKVLRSEIGNINSLTEEKLDELVQSFLNDFKNGNLQRNGWPTFLSAYTVSKVALNAYTRIIAQKYPTICTNCVSPGYVKTDLNNNTGILTAEDGAKGPVMLALLPDGSPSGLFYDMTRVSSEW